MTKISSGFTIIEMMVVVTVIGVLAALAAPSFTQMIINNRIASEANGLVGDLALARSEALKLGGGSRVTVCASADGAACSGGSSWTDGRIVFVDSTSSGTLGTVDPGETIIRKSGAIAKATLVSSGFSTAGFVSFGATGTMSSSTQGAFTICVPSYIGRVVTISTTGRSSLARTTSACL